MVGLAMASYAIGFGPGMDQEVLVASDTVLPDRLPSMFRYTNYFGGQSRMKNNQILSTINPLPYKVFHHGPVGEVAIHTPKVPVGTPFLPGVELFIHHMAGTTKF